MRSARDLVRHHGVADKGNEDHEIDGQQWANPSCDAGAAGDSFNETGEMGHRRKLDRLARDLIVNESVLADFERKGVTVIRVAEPDLCSGEPTSGRCCIRSYPRVGIHLEILHLRHDIGSKRRHSRRPRRSIVPA